MLSKQLLSFLANHAAKSRNCVFPQEKLTLQKRYVLAVAEYFPEGEAYTGFMRYEFKSLGTGSA